MSRYERDFKLYDKLIRRRNNIDESMTMTLERLRANVYKDFSKTYIEDLKGVITKYGKDHEINMIDEILSNYSTEALTILNIQQLNTFHKKYRIYISYKKGFIDRFLDCLGGESDDE